MHNLMTSQQLIDILQKCNLDTEVVVNMAYNHYDIVAFNNKKGYIELLLKLCHDREEMDDEPLKTI